MGIGSAAMVLCKKLGVLPDDWDSALMAL